MKQFENKNGTFMVSGNVEVDTDDLVEPEDTKPEKVLSDLKEKVNKLIESKSEDDFVSKSTCAIHIYFTETLKSSGTLEHYKRYIKPAIIPYYSSSEKVYIFRQITMWVGYDSLVAYFNGSEDHGIQKVNIEHIAGHEQVMIFGHHFYYYEFEIMEINGPLFKIRLELASET